MYILITGNPVDGLTFTGPFDTHDDAVASGDLAGADWWVTEIQPVTS